MDRLLGVDHEDERIVLGLLTTVEHDGERSQRHIAAELGIALGLVNAYLRRCVKKGLVKVRDVPARRYAYYLTPHGFAEKSRLTVQYLSDSFSFFRLAKGDCAQAFEIANDRRPRVTSSWPPYQARFAGRTPRWRGLPGRNDHCASAAQREWSPN